MRKDLIIPLFGHQKRKVRSIWMNFQNFFASSTERVLGCTDGMDRPQRRSAGDFSAQYGRKGVALTPKLVNPNPPNSGLFAGNAPISTVSRTNSVQFRWASPVR
jgi:hypothetical protein